MTFYLQESFTLIYADSWEVCNEEKKNHVKRQLLTTLRALFHSFHIAQVPSALSIIVYTNYFEYRIPVQCAHCYSILPLASPSEDTPPGDNLALRRSPAMPGTQQVLNTYLRMDWKTPFLPSH